MNQRVRIVVGGRVQGVFFRATTCDVARRLKLAGWVRNCPDGTVEIVAEGDPEALVRLRDWCRKGPPGARVDMVREERESPTGADATFRIIG